MFTLACKDVGMPDCQFVAEGATADEVMMKAGAHATEVHGMTEADMTPEKKEVMMSMVKEA